MNVMMRYLKVVIKHKYFVFLAGLKTNVGIWNLIIHDLSKFSRYEAPQYARHFYGDKTDSLGFEYAWNHHIHCNKHHWEYWVKMSVNEIKPLPMPEKYVREMVADWMGASRAYEGQWPQLGQWSWFDKNFEKIRLHPNTRKLVLEILREIYGRTKRRTNRTN